MKSVLITGCSSGFGYELVARFLERNWKVYATLRSVEERRGLFAAELSRYPDRLEILELDVTSDLDRQKVSTKLDAEGKGLDCLVNNAGFGLFGAFEDLSEAQIRKQFEVNVFGLFFLTRQLLPLLRKNQGRILNISSVVGYLGVPFTSMYASSKFALEGFTESLAFELEPFGVQVCLIEPGRHRTQFSKNQNLGEKALDPFSPYFKFTKRFKKYREDLSSGPGVPSYHVVDEVARLSEVSRLPMRRPVGRDAWLSYLCKRWLPSRVFYALVAQTFRRAFFVDR